MVQGMVKEWCNVYVNVQDCPRLSGRVRLRPEPQTSSVCGVIGGRDSCVVSDDSYVLADVQSSISAV